MSNVKKVKDLVKNAHKIENNLQAKNVAHLKSIMTWGSWKMDVNYIRIYWMPSS
jgi:hypothetical protein